LEGVGELTPTPENIRPRIDSIKSFSLELNRDVAAVVRAGQKAPSSLQTWLNEVDPEGHLAGAPAQPTPIPAHSADFLPVQPLANREDKRISCASFLFGSCDYSPLRHACVTDQMSRHDRDALLRRADAVTTAQHSTVRSRELSARFRQGRGC
jgi:hypothetical protein